MTINTPASAQTFELRDQFWSKVGQLDPDILAPLINPAFTGGPKWPSLHQGFRKITLRDQSIILASDGLSDPFEDQPEKKVNGFELEFYIHTSPQPNNLATSWQMDILNQMAQIAADNGSVRSQLDKYHYMTVELFSSIIPKNFCNQSGRVGVLLGLTTEKVPEIIQLPMSSAKMVSIVLLTAKELEYIVQNGSVGRENVAQKLQETTKDLSSLDRSSVI